MNVHERVIALVTGELREESEASELLHRLSVSPEKLRVLLDQIGVSRALASHAASQQPPAAADLAILAFAGVATTPLSSELPPKPASRRWFQRGPLPVVFASGAALL